MALKAYRSMLRRDAGPRRDAPAADRLNRERYARRKSRELLKAAMGHRRRPKLDKPMLATRFRPSELLDGLVPDRRRRWLPVLDRCGGGTVVQVRLENFSFLEQPAETLKQLRRVAETECTAVQAHLHFMDERCIDIGAYLVLGEIWPAMAPVYVRGHMPPPVQKVVKAIGLGRQLGMVLAHAEDLSDIWAYPLKRRRPSGSSQSDRLLLEPQTREKTADGLCEAMNAWLHPLGEELTAEGRAWITSITGELLENAERHSQPGSIDGDWTLAAFMARREEDGEEVFRCYLGFLSTGATIADSLVSAASRIQEDLANYCTRHRAGPASQNTLRTLFASQDGITRVPEAEAGGRGGYGLQEVLDFINVLGGTSKPGREPRMTIISGQSCIHLRAPYIKGERKTGVGGPRVLWCNPANSPESPPDPAYVYDLPERFAGTVISLAFTLDPDYLNAAASPGDQDA